MSLISSRKQDHIDAVLNDPQVDRQQSGFDSIQLTHRALPEIDFSKVSTETNFLNKKISFPFLVSSMTGGTSDGQLRINKNLALAAEEMQVALAVGSQRIMLESGAAIKSFQLRKFAPSIPIIANIGAVQLNYGVEIDDIKRIIDTLEADAVYLHLNALQEIIQPEGDTNFENLLTKIEQLQQHLHSPIILKEVGCGFSTADFEAISKTSIQWVDVAGRGGTSWSRIESHRGNNQNQQDLGQLFQDWGLTTVQSLTFSQPFQEQISIISSGGIRNGIDMIKSVIMGAQICGVAAPLLEAAIDSDKAVAEKIAQYKAEFQTAQFLLGQKNIQSLKNNDTLIIR